MGNSTPSIKGGSSSNIPKVEVKTDPEAAAPPAAPVLKIKKEEIDSDEEPFVNTIPQNEEDSKDDDMFDDVDGAEYVDLTYEGIAEVDGVDCFVCEEFKIRQIPKPIIVTRPLIQLFDCIVSGHITLDPDYQREVVWDEGRAALLINSILMGYFIPPIIFNCVKKSLKQPDGTEATVHRRICVDGKQRLTSVYKFMTGVIGFYDSSTPQKKWYFCHPTHEGVETLSNRNILPNAVKQFFKEQAFCCYEYDELTVDTEETMFQLVQRGVALTPAEKMRAMSTEWATFAKRYEDDYPLVINLSKQNRASGFRLVLTIFTMVQEVLSGKKKRSAAPTLQASPQALGRILEDKTPINEVVKTKLKSIFDRYEVLIKLSSIQLTTTRYKVERDSPFDPAPIWLRGTDVDHVRTFSPLELVGTAILITVHGDKRTDEELLEDLKQMRHYLRVLHQDLRVNAQCWMTTWDFISRLLELQWVGKFPKAKFLTHEEARIRDREAAAAERAAERAASVKAVKAASKASKSSKEASVKNESESTGWTKSSTPEDQPPKVSASASNGNGPSTRQQRVKYIIDSSDSEDMTVPAGFDSDTTPSSGKSDSDLVDGSASTRTGSTRLESKVAGRGKLAASTKHSRSSSSSKSPATGPTSPKKVKTES